MKAFLYHSGGKDAITALHLFIDDYGIYPELLVCTVDEYDMVAAHQVHKSCIEAQAKAMELPVQFITIPAFSANATFEHIVLKHLSLLKKQGYTHAICGDIFLEEIKTYREELHKKIGVECVFPLWGINTQTLSKQIIDLGLKAIITSVDTKYLPANYVGTEYNSDFINNLPDNIDPCGENGEFHTFVYNAPLFQHQLQIEIGKTGEVNYNPDTPYATTMVYQEISCL